MLMKKILLSAALFAALSTVSAQKLTFIPYADNGYLTGTLISPNGSYVAGSDLGGQAFIYNTELGQIKYFASPSLGDENSEDAEADIRCISDEGVGVGYIENKACKFDFATGTYTLLLDEASTASFLSTDGTLTAGFTFDENNFGMLPYFQKDDEKHLLPCPTSDWLGYDSNGFAVTGGNSDGSILVRYIQDDWATHPLCIWVRNQDGETYSVIPTSKRFYDASIDLDGPQELDYFEGAAISENGKWICLNVHQKSSEDNGLVIARYNVPFETVEFINCPDVTPNTWYYANSISNDGTIVGYIEDQISYGRKGMICLAGETEAKRLTEVYPDVPELKQLDLNDFHTPCAITPDGRYIEGFGYVDYDETSLCFGTYFLDTQASGSGVERISSADNTAKVVASFDVDGKNKHFRKSGRALRIDKLANGRTRKVAE